VSFLVDTNVLSELAKTKPEAQVIVWLREHEPDLYPKKENGKIARTRQVT
jgi:predicted nucleic acid-binding protein